MSDLFESFVQFCEKRNIPLAPKDLVAIRALSGKLGVSSSELLSIVVIELLEETPAGLRTIPAILSRVRKRIAREYKRNRRATQLRFDPVSNQDEMGAVQLRDAITLLSPMHAEVIQLALEGADIAGIASQIHKTQRTVYRILNDAIGALKAMMQPL